MLAPILLFVYNRPWHTRQTLDALSSNILADESILYIYSDGPKEDASQEDLNKIRDVRDLLREQFWCGEVKIIERDKNLGLAESVISGVSEVINEFGHVIILEDDIVTGKYFLKFMNKALELYESEKKVFGITGYKYPSTKKVIDSTYFLPIASSWSFGIWKDRWDKVNFNASDLLQKISKGNLQEELDFGGNPYYEMLKSQVEGRIDSWAIRFYGSMFIERAYFLYPNRSLVCNIGFDNSGTHCQNDDFFTRSKITQKSIEISQQEIILKQEILKNFKTSFKNMDQKKSKFYFLKKMLYLMKIK